MAKIKLSKTLMPSDDAKKLGDLLKKNFIASELSGMGTAVVCSPKNAPTVGPEGPHEPPYNKNDMVSIKEVIRKSLGLDIYD